MNELHSNRKIISKRISSISDLFKVYTGVDIIDHAEVYTLELFFGYDPDQAINQTIKINCVSSKGLRDFSKMIYDAAESLEIIEKAEDLKQQV